MATLSQASIDYSESEDVVDSGYCTSESSDDQNSPSLSEPIHPPPYDNGVAVMLVFHPQIQLVPVCFATCGPILHPPSLPNCVPSADSPASIPAPRLRKNCRRLIKWSLPPPSSAPLSLPGWQPMPYGLENFWTSAFAWFFRPLWISHQHLWTLEPITLPPVSTQWPWHSASYSAKVRYQCQMNHGWTSMKGRVVFWFRVRRQGDQIISEVLFKIYGQQCNRCLYLADEVDFIAALWYPEEIENAIRLLFARVVSTYYGGYREPLPHRLRQGCPTNHHDPSRCQACYEGICRS